MAHVGLDRVRGGLGHGHAQVLDAIGVHVGLELGGGGDDDPHEALRKATKETGKALKKLEERMWGKEVKQGILRGKGLANEVRRELGALTNSPEAPNPTERLGLARARAKVGEATAAVETFTKEAWADFRAAVAASGLGLLAADKSK